MTSWPPSRPRVWTAAELIDVDAGDYDCNAARQETDGGYECCRPEGHDGPHMAWALDQYASVRIVDIWEVPS